MSTIEFDKRIFKLTAIKAAVRDYREFADFQFRVEGDQIIVEIQNIAYEPVPEFLDEFGNYVIHKMSARA